MDEEEVRKPLRSRTGSCSLPRSLDALPDVFLPRRQEPATRRHPGSHRLALSSFPPVPLQHRPRRRCHHSQQATETLGLSSRSRSPRPSPPRHQPRHRRRCPRSSLPSPSSRRPPFARPLSPLPPPNRSRHPNARRSPRNPPPVRHAHVPPPAHRHWLALGKRTPFADVRRGRLDPYPSNGRRGDAAILPRHCRPTADHLAAQLSPSFPRLLSHSYLPHLVRRICPLPHALQRRRRPDPVRGRRRGRRGSVRRTRERQLRVPARPAARHQQASSPRSTPTPPPPWRPWVFPHREPYSRRTCELEGGRVCESTGQRAEG